MGQVFARRLMDAGFAVVGYDVEPAKNAQLDADGRRGRRVAAEVARRAP